MHRHFTDAGCVLMFGGGARAGHVHGQTADERPCKIIKDPLVIDDLHATIYRTMGISPRLAYDIEQRPFYVTRGREGTARNGSAGIVVPTQINDPANKTPPVPPMEASGS